MLSRFAGTHSCRDKGYAHAEAKFDAISVLKRHLLSRNDILLIQAGAVRALKIEQIVVLSRTADTCVAARDRVRGIMLGEVEIERDLVLGVSATNNHEVGFEG